METLGIPKRREREALSAVWRRTRWTGTRRGTKLERAWTATVETQSRYNIMTVCVRRLGVASRAKIRWLVDILDGPNHFSTVVVVGECGVDCDPNVDEL
jgi:hypothetical protein